MVEMTKEGKVKVGEWGGGWVKEKEVTGKGVREIGGIGIGEVWERQVVMGVEGQGRRRKERKKKEIKDMV